MAVGGVIITRRRLGPCSCRDGRPRAAGTVRAEFSRAARGPDPMNIVVSNVKGGVGKTTTAVYLAAVAGRRGRGPVAAGRRRPPGFDGGVVRRRPPGGGRAGGGTLRPHRHQGDEPGGRHRRGRHAAGGGQRRPGGAGPGRRRRHPDPGRRGRAQPGRHDAGDDARNIPAGVVICSARLGTNDLEATIEWWTELKVPVWGIVPERVSIASGPRRPSRARAWSTTQGVEEGDRQEPLTRCRSAGGHGLQLGVEPAVGPGHRRLAVQLADELGEEPAAHRHAGGRRRQGQEPLESPNSSASSSMAS